MLSTSILIRSGDFLGFVNNFVDKSLHLLFRNHVIPIEIESLIWLDFISVDSEIAFIGSILTSGNIRDREVTKQLFTGLFVDTVGSELVLVARGHQSLHGSVPLVAEYRRKFFGADADSGLRKSVSFKLKGF